MRIAWMTLFCTLVLAAFGGSGGRADDKTDADKELKKFQGAWTFEHVEAGGKVEPAADFMDMAIAFEGKKFTVRKGDAVVMAGTMKLDPSKSPKAIDVTVTEGVNKGADMLGIYEMGEETLKVCFDPAGKKRPTEFKTADGSATFVNVHKRVKK